MKVHFLYWRINFTIFWRCKVTYYKRVTLRAASSFFGGLPIPAVRRVSAILADSCLPTGLPTRHLARGTSGERLVHYSIFGTKEQKPTILTGW